VLANRKQLLSGGVLRGALLDRLGNSCSFFQNVQEWYSHSVWWAAELSGSGHSCIVC